MNIALLFPGQGAQFVGMGKDFYENSVEARAVIDAADRVLNSGDCPRTGNFPPPCGEGRGGGISPRITPTQPPPWKGEEPFSLKNVMFNGPEEKLTLTAYSQPAIFAMSLAALETLKAHPKFRNFQPKFAAGLSLGEYSALAACEALPFEETLRLLKKRSEYMEEACRLNKGAMAAVMGLAKEQIVEICKKAGSEVANFNSPEQTVITGHADKVEAACKLCEAAGAKGVVPLSVSGAFHSSLMKTAADKFSKELDAVRFHKPQFPLVSNVDGKPSSDAGVIKQKLSQQITSSVQWVETISSIKAAGVDTFIEIGPGKVLKGLLRRIDKGLTIFNISSLEEIEKIEIA